MKRMGIVLVLAVLVGSSVLLGGCTKTETENGVSWEYHVEF